MVVRQDYRRRILEDGGFENFAGVTYGGAQTAHLNDIHADYDILGVQHEANELLSIGLEELVSKDRHDVVGIVNCGSRLDLNYPVADQLDMVNRNVFL